MFSTMNYKKLPRPLQFAKLKLLPILQQLSKNCISCDSREKCGRLATLKISLELKNSETKKLQEEKLHKHI